MLIGWFRPSFTLHAGWPDEFCRNRPNCSPTHFKLIHNFYRWKRLPRSLGNFFEKLAKENGRREAKKCQIWSPRVLSLTNLCLTTWSIKFQAIRQRFHSLHTISFWGRKPNNSIIRKLSFVPMYTWENLHQLGVIVKKFLGLIIVEKSSLDCRKYFFGL
jgi:hypothetical protein